LLAFRTSDRD
jgi:hypothetical protein